MVVKSTALGIALGLVAFAFGETASAQTAERTMRDAGLTAYAQSQTNRARTRIRVTPRCPYRTQTVDYPVQYECDYPGPGYVRECVAQLVKEYRPSGTVIVPVTHCWWQRG